MKKHKAYTILMALELASIGIKYQASTTNPFQQSNPTKLIFLTAVFSHLLAFTANMNLPITNIIFHVSGVLGCETLLWILVPEYLWYYIVNLLLLLVAPFCFFDYIANISQYLRGAIPSNADHIPNMQPQETEDRV